jgi:hypothetical protein
VVTAISTEGLLSVGENEIAKSITVKATSNFDPTIFNEVTVVIGEVGITDISTSSISVYPNPTSGELTVSSEYNVLSIEVFDMMGKKVRANNYSPQLGVVSTLNLDHLPAGTYFLKIEIENGMVVKKVIKQ